MSSTPVLLFALLTGCAGARSPLPEPIVRWDRAAAGSRRLAHWRARFREGAPGTRLRLSVDRAGARLEIDAVLVELVP